MINYLEVLYSLMQQEHYLLVILISLYAVSATIDYIIGTTIAYVSPNIIYSSRIGQLGLVRKLGTLLVMVLIIPLALFLPFHVGVYTLTILYAGINASEIYSILGHIGVVKDGNKNKELIGGLFNQFFENVFNATKERNK